MTRAGYPEAQLRSARRGVDRSGQGRTPAEHQPGILRKATRHCRGRAHQESRLAVVVEAGVVEAGDPVVTPLAVDVVVAGLTGDCGSDEDRLAASEGRHQVRQIALLYMFEEFDRPPKI